MVNSQNGWPASSDRASIGVVPFTVHGVAFPGGVKGGDVATVLAYVADQFHRRVEALVGGWCWGHAYRATTGGGAVSNHGSGTAIDVNAPRHPYGVTGTFSGVQRATIRAILDEVNRVVRWGGDYVGTKDDMHFEINAGAASVATVAARLRTPQPPPPKENDMRNLILAQEKDSPRVWVGDGLFRRHVPDEATLEDLQHWIGRQGGDATVHSPWANLDALGLDITDAFTAPEGLKTFDS